MARVSSWRRRANKVWLVVALLLILPLVVVHNEDMIEDPLCDREPIDIVYYYVNGSDTEQQELLEASRHTHTRAKAATKNRYRDWDELRYSVRSVYRHAPWFNRMYFVLRNNSTQVPSWLDRNALGDRVQIVTHEEIFDDPGHLPTLSSNAIEANLHKIPGLTRRFLLMNDDFFFFRHTPKRAFFPTHTEHSVCMYLANMPGAEAELGVDPPATQLCARKISQLLDAEYGAKHRRDECHSPQPVDIILMRKLQETYTSDFEAASASRFRSDTICPRLFYNHWVLESQEGRFRANSRLSALKYSLLVQLRDSLLITKLQFLLARFLRPRFVGVNDDVSEDASEELIQEISVAFRGFIDGQFPQKSPIEKSTPS